MTDMIKDGLAWFTARLVEHASQTVTVYDATNSVDVPAVLCRKLLKITDVDGGVRMQWTDLDILVPVSWDDGGVTKYFTFGGTTIIEPVRGLKVDVVANAYDTQTFEVFPYGGEPPWHWEDPNQTLMRIHLKRIDSDAFSVA